MNTNGFIDRLAVCSWSLQPNTPDELIAKLKRIGIPRSRRLGVPDEGVRLKGAFQRAAAPLEFSLQAVLERVRTS